MAKESILVVEDDVDINNLLCYWLKNDGYSVTPAFSGSEAQLRIEANSFDLILLDLMIPGISGESLIIDIRQNKLLTLPIIIISAKIDLKNKVDTLRLGADDYITKPFAAEEVLARVYACLRRYQGVDKQITDEAYHYNDINLLTESRKVTVKGKEVFLTNYEYEILLILIREPHKVFSREKLYEMVWQQGYYGEDNTVNVHVSNLRKKLASIDGEKDFIKTVWGIGFKMDDTLD